MTVCGRREYRETECGVFREEVGVVACIAAAVLDEEPEEIWRSGKECNHNEDNEYNEHKGLAAAGPCDHRVLRKTTLKSMFTWAPDATFIDGIHIWTDICTYLKVLILLIKLFSCEKTIAVGRNGASGGFHRLITMSG